MDEILTDEVVGVAYDTRPYYSSSANYLDWFLGWT